MDDDHNTNNIDDFDAGNPDHNGGGANNNLDPALQQSNEINTAPGGYNPYPLNFARSEVQDDLKVVHSPHLLGPEGLVLGDHGLAQRTTGGRASIMLGEDGKPIPEDQKPPVGTEAYARMRKINHKEVERKRRQTINEGVDELAKLIASPHGQPEKNKGAVLQKTVNYIIELKRNENNNIEKYTMDKYISDQQIAELRTEQENLLQQLHLLQQRAELWKQAAHGDESARARAKALEL